MADDRVVLGKKVVVRDGARLYDLVTGNRGKINNYSIVFGSPRKPARIGDDFFIGAHCYLQGYYGLDVGDRVTIAHGVMIFSDSGPNTSPILQKSYPILKGKVIIGDDVWIGAGAIIMPGITIGDRVVIGARALVKKSVPSGSVVAGIPAKIIKRI